jgi:hypothetical protein
MAFADRVQKHLFGSGALTTAEVEKRWLQRANQIDAAIIAESARWGNYWDDTPLSKSDWLKEQKRLVNHYFPRRTNILLQQLRRAGLYPSLDTPSVEIKTEGQARKLVLTAKVGKIYYRTDGHDPRKFWEGSILEGSEVYGKPIQFSKDLNLKARVFDQGKWSSLLEVR